MSPKNSVELREYLKELKNCTEYLKIEEVGKWKEKYLNIYFI